MRYISILAIVLSSFISAHAQVVITENISEDTVWGPSDEYILDGLIFVEEGASLTIEAGTVIKGRAQGDITTGDGASALIVRRGAQIFAEGTGSSPIIFTAESDDVNDPLDLTYQDRGLWGGVIILGEATTNQPTTDNQIEGIPGEENALYGGDNDADDSGVFRYVSIRHAGFSISGVSGDEINGLTMGAVGSGTTIEYVEIFANFDDAFEWFGGTVNTKYLVNAFSGDDGFDYDQGFRGKGQFWFSVQAADRAGRGGEHDGGDDDETGTPFATPMIANATYIGSGNGATVAEGDNNDRVFAIRDNAGGEYYNSIFTDFAGVGLNIEDLDSEVDSRQRLEEGDLVFNNNLWWEIGNNDLASIAPQDFVADYISDATNGNQIVNPGLRGISRDTDAGLDPRPEAGSNAGSGAMSLDDSFFTSTSYYGAFGNDNWALGWTALDAYGYLSSEIVTDIEDGPATLPTSIALNQNYPNPFNPTTQISFTLPQAQQVTLKVYDMLGREVATLANRENFSAGQNTLNFNATNLSSGVYIYRLTSGDVSITRKMSLIK